MKSKCDNKKKISKYVKKSLREVKSFAMYDKMLTSGGDDHFWFIFNEDHVIVCQQEIGKAALGKVFISRRMFNKMINLYNKKQTILL